MRYKNFNYVITAASNSKRQVEVRCNSNFSQTEPSQLHLLLNKAEAIYSSKLHLRT